MAQKLGRIASISLTAFIMGLAARDVRAASAWYAGGITTNLAYAQAVTIAADLTTENLTNFPVLVVITNQSNPVFSRARSDGGDIAFFSADGQTRFDHEIEVYTNSGSKQFVAWVKVPLIVPGKSTYLQMCYGNPAIENQQNAAGVWNNAFLGVWHLSETTGNGGARVDSTANGHNASRVDPSGRGGAGAPGKIAACDSFAGYEDHYDRCVGGVANNTNGWTLSAWIFANTNGFQMFEASDNSGTAYASVSGSYGLLSEQTDSGQTLLNVPGLTSNTWHHLVFVCKPNVVTYGYLDGELVAYSGEYTRLIDQNRCAFIGRYLSDGYAFNGRVDELQMSGVTRSAGWIKAAYKNQNDPVGAVAFGAEGTIGPFGYRQQVAVASSMSPNGDVTNFPVLILITNATNHVFGVAQTNGGDILFTAADGTNKLAHEMEYYSGTGTLAAWVKVPRLSHTNDTLLYMYYGNATVPSQANGTSVWTEGFSGVWHLSEATGNGGMRLDSTANGHTASRVDLSGRGGAGAAGKIAACDSFAGYDDHYDRCVGGVANNTNGWTLSAWIYAGNTNAFGMFESSDNNGYAYAAVNSGYGMLSEPTDSVQTFLYAPGFTQATWHHLVFVCNPNNQSYGYIDGEIVAYSGEYTRLIDANRCAFIGRYLSNTYPFNGRVDELRMSGVTRSADWIKASYRNQSNPDAYVSLSAPQARPIPGLIFRFR